MQNINSIANSRLLCQIIFTLISFYLFLFTSLFWIHFQDCWTCQSALSMMTDISPIPAIPSSSLQTASTRRNCREYQWMPSTSIPSYTQLTPSPAYSISQDSQITPSEKRPCLKLDWVSELSEFSLNVYYFIEVRKPAKVWANKTPSTVQNLQDLFKASLFLSFISRK